MYPAAFFSTLRPWRRGTWERKTRWVLLMLPACLREFLGHIAGSYLDRPLQSPWVKMKQVGRKPKATKGNTESTREERFTDVSGNLQKFLLKSRWVLSIRKSYAFEETTTKATNLKNPKHRKHEDGEEKGSDTILRQPRGVGVGNKVLYRGTVLRMTTDLSEAVQAKGWCHLNVLKEKTTSLIFCTQWKYFSKMYVNYKQALQNLKEFTNRSNAENTRFFWQKKTYQQSGPTQGESTGNAMWIDIFRVSLEDNWLQQIE